MGSSATTPAPKVTDESGGSRLQAGGPISIVGILAILATWTGYLQSVSNYLKLDIAYVRWIFGAITAIGVVQWFAYRSSANSRLIAPDLLADLGSHDQASLLDRSDDIARLEQYIRTSPEVLLVGESGIGKTALLEFGLCPNLKAKGGVVIAIDEFGADWDVACQKRFCQQLLHSLDPSQRERFSVRQPFTFKKASEVIADLNTQLNIVPILIMDQFERYVTSHHDQLIPSTTHTWLKPNELIDRNEFWRRVSRWVSDDKLRLVVTIRSDASDALSTFTFREASVYRVDRLRRAAAAILLKQLTEKGIASNPQNGWNDLAAQLTRDLSSDGRILPVQMKIVLQNLDALPQLTIEKYARANGLAGMEASFVESRVASAAEASGLSKRSVLNLVLDMIEVSGLAGEAPISKPATRNMIASRGSPQQLEKCLALLVDKKLLRVRHNPDSDELEWTIYHDYLCHAVLEAKRRDQRWEVRLKERATAHYKAPGPWQKWTTLLDPLLFARFIVERISGRLQFSDNRRFMQLSTLRLVPYLAVASGLWLMADYGVVFPGSDRIRDYTDRLNISVHRRPDPMNKIDVESIEAATKAMSRITAHNNSEGWIQDSGSDSAVIDYWTHAQALAAVFHGFDVQSGAQTKYGSGLDLLFENGKRVVIHNKSYGWAHDNEKPYTRVEPVAWAGIALAAVCGLKNDITITTETSKCDDRMLYVENSLDSYHAGDGWNIFANQSNPELHSAYATALVLPMFLEWYEHDLSWRGSKDTLKAKIKEAANWLVEQWLVGGGTAGWHEGREATPVGLKLQGFAVLLRAETHGLVTVPPTLKEEIVGTVRNNSIEHLDISPADTQMVRQSITFRTPDGSLTRLDTPEIFIWYPWAVELMARLVEAPETSKVSREDRMRIRKILTYLVTSSNKYLEQNDQYVFLDSECLYAFGSLHKVLSTHGSGSSLL